MLERLGKELVLSFPLGPIRIAFDPLTMAAAVGVTLLLVGLAIWLRRGIPEDPEAPPTRRAAFLAKAFELAETMLLGGLSADLARSLFPLIATVFLYVLFCNWISILPIPGIISPTQDLNVTLSLAVMVYALTHWYGMRRKGTWRHIKGYFEPFPFFLPMNLMGDFGRTLSHGFRLFGNVLGGAILTTVITALIPVILPIITNAFFGLFSGAIQALVFALLAAAYINIAAE